MSGEYPAWEYREESKLREIYVNAYEAMFGKRPEVALIHAGLECGILSGAYPNWDMISCGPTLVSPHSPDERCYIPTVQKVWDYLIEVVKRV